MAELTAGEAFLGPGSIWSSILSAQAEGPLSSINAILQHYSRTGKRICEKAWRDCDHYTQDFPACTKDGGSSKESAESFSC
jgi:hypothetical protein